MPRSRQICGKTMQKSAMKAELNRDDILLPSPVAGVREPRRRAGWSGRGYCLPIGRIRRALPGGPRFDSFALFTHPLLRYIERAAEPCFGAPVQLAGPSRSKVIIEN